MSGSVTETQDRIIAEMLRFNAQIKHLLHIHGACVDAEATNPEASLEAITILNNRIEAMLNASQRR